MHGKGSVGDAVSRVAARHLADLDPPLGFPGGPCHVIERVRHEVPNVHLREDLVDEVERGLSLTNPDAARVYPVEDIRLPANPRRFETVEIGPHAAYRMDLRGITVPEIKLAIAMFSKHWADLRSQHHPMVRRWEEDVAYERTIAWTSPKLRLTLVMAIHGDTIKLVTLYWEGMPDPRPPGEGGCDGMSRSAEEGSPNSKTLVSPKSEKNLPTDSDREKEQALPAGSATPGAVRDEGGGGSRRLPYGQFSKPDETTKVQDRPRSKGVPGEEYGTPTKFDYNMPTRRTMTAAEMEQILTAYQARVPWKQQRQQPTFDRLHDKRYYQTRRNRINRRVKLWYKGVKRNLSFQDRKDKRRENPDRYKRRRQASLEVPILFGRALEPGTLLAIGDGQARFEVGGVTRSLPVPVFLASVAFSDPEDYDRLVMDDTDYGVVSVEEVLAAADRAGFDTDTDDFIAWLREQVGTADLQALDEESLEHLEDLFVSGSVRLAYVPNSLSTHRHRQRGRPRYDRHRSYVRNKARAHRQQHIWYKRNKHRPQFVRRQVLRHQHPTRFRLRPASADVDLPLLAGADLQPGRIVDVSEEGVVTAVVGSSLLIVGSTAFMHAVVFLSDADVHAAFVQIEEAAGEHAFDNATPEDLRVVAKFYGVESESDPSDPDAIVDAIVAIVDSLPENRVAADTFVFDKKPPGDLPQNWQSRDLDTGTDTTERKDTSGRSYVESGPGQVTNVAPNQTHEPTPGGGGHGPDRTLPSGSGKVVPEHLKHGHLETLWGSCRVAAKIQDLLDGTASPVHRRSEERTAVLRRAAPAQGIWTFDVYGGEKPYRVRVKGLKRGRTKALDRMDVQVSCTCPFYRWQGPEHWATAEAYMYGRPQGTATFPRVRDPGRNHLVCKHAILALETALAYKIP